jgi:hypothetical protein
MNQLRKTMLISTALCLISFPLALGFLQTKQTALAVFLLIGCFLHARIAHKAYRQSLKYQREDAV